LSANRAIRTPHDRPRLTAVKARYQAGRYELDLVWNDGRRANIDLRGLLNRVALLQPLLSPARFLDIRLINWGHGVGWGGDPAPADDPADGGDPEFDLSSEKLRALADLQEPVDAERLRNFMDRFHLNRKQTAQWLGRSDTMLRKYLAGSAPIPRALSLMIAAAERDPTVIDAHYIPAKAKGRPRQDKVILPTAS
jgi:hypothetical protein